MIQKFYQALERKDFSAVRTYFHDRFSFKGPIDSFDSVAPYLEAVQGLSAIVKRVEIKKIFADENDVCVLYDLVTDSPAGTCFVAEWFQIEDGKIAAIRVIFDLRPFEFLFAGRKK